MGHLVAILDDDGALEAALNALERSGVDLNEMHVLSGPEGARPLDRKGVRHGLWGRLLRLAQLTTFEGDALELHERSLADGHHVVYVPSGGRDRTTRLAEVLRAAGGHHQVHFGRSTVEGGYALPLGAPSAEGALNRPHPAQERRPRTAERP